MSFAILFDAAIVAAGLYALFYRRRLIERAWQGFGGDRNSPLVTLGVTLGATVVILFGVLSIAHELF